MPEEVPELFPPPSEVLELVPELLPFPPPLVVSDSVPEAAVILITSSAELEHSPSNAEVPSLI